MTPFALLDNSRDHNARYYHHYCHRDTLDAEHLDQLDSLLQRGWQQGLHCTLRLPYEFGRDLIGLSRHSACLAIDWYQHCEMLSARRQAAFFRAWRIHHRQNLRGILISSGEIDKTRYREQIQKIHQHILAGDVYQINYTEALDGQFSGDPVLLYATLRERQPAPYAALMAHPDDGHTLCFSPECFLTLDGKTVFTEPMKGTAAAPDDPVLLARAKATLRDDPKNRAENAMIVDLLRNDLSRVAEPFSVQVEQPFAVHQYGSVLQMTSRVRAHLRNSVTIADLIRATFPCGSITGAPKHMAMQIIHRLEKRPRGIYTGAIGYLEPGENGICGGLNVAIRTLTIKDDRTDFGVGGGITIESNADLEYQECQTKAAFLRLPAPVSLFETLRIENRQPQRLREHRARLAHSAAALRLPTPPGETQLAAQIQAFLAQQKEPDLPWRMKLFVDTCGFSISGAPITNTPAPYCRIHDTALPVKNPLRRFKTSDRSEYDRAWQQAAANGAFDGLIFNTRGELLEGGRSNVFLYCNGQWLTPPLSLDILPGVMRAQVMKNPALIGAERIEERLLHLKDLQQAEKILLTNSLRGILAVTLIR